uniref:HSP70 n=1 Tax=Rhizophora mucronata TaxID=61149 RepID=A0A2P2QWR1_RHIMU
MISTLSCCQTPTHEYVVPRSIPIAGPSPLPDIVDRRPNISIIQPQGYRKYINI